MRCGQCGRKLTDAARAMGYCPSCGNLVPEDEQLSLAAAQPALPQTPAQSGASDLALPPPAARLSRPIAPPPLVNASATPRYSHPIDIPTARPAAGPSRPLPQPPVMPPPAPAAVVTQVRPQSTNALLITLIALIAIIVVAGGALFVAGKQDAGPLAFLGTTPGHITPIATATATALPTHTPAPTATPVPAVPSPPPGYVTYYSQNRTFGLNYDQSWTANGPTPDSGERGNSYNFTSPQQQFFQVTEAATTIVPADVTQFIQTFIVNSNGTDFQMTGSVTTNTNGANTWTTAQGTYTSNAQTWNIIGLASNHKQHGYIIIYTAPAPVYTTVSGSQFAEMVNSFTFL